MTDASTRLLTVLTRHFGAIETTEQDPLDAQVLRDLKPDSLDMVEVMMELEDEFQIAITDDEAMAMSEDATVRDVLALVEGKLAA